MNLCDYNHAEVCYEGRTCPACAIKEELEEEIDSLKQEIDSLKQELREAQEAAS